MKTIPKILGVGIVASTVMLSSVALAQGRFLFPSASFFSPNAYGFESSDSVFKGLSGMKQHSEFHSQLESSNIVSELRGSYLTVLAPTDKAFDNLPTDVKAKLANPEKLKQLLKYHFVAEKITEEDIQRQAVATLLEQTSVSITGIPAGDQIGVKLNDATATEPFPFGDGVVIPIDRVLIPPGF